MRQIVLLTAFLRGHLTILNFKLLEDPFKCEVCQKLVRFVAHQFILLKIPLEDFRYSSRRKHHLLQKPQTIPNAAAA